MRDSALPTLAVAVSWLVVGALLAGCGMFTRRAVLAWLSLSTERRLRPADLWIGLTAVVAYLQVWSLFGGIGPSTWFAPAVAGAAGVAVSGARLPRLHPTRRTLIVATVTGVGILWLANRALGEATSYDSALYHFASIEYASDFATVPGLGNLHDRLGAGNAHLLFVAFLGQWPWSDAGFHLANGLLVAMLFVDIGARFRAAADTASFTRHLALLLVPATLVSVGADTGSRLSSPSIDLPAFVLVAAASLYLAAWVERGREPVDALTTTALLALATATRPLFVVPTLIAGGYLVVASTRGSVATAAAAVRSTALVWTMPLAVLLGSAGRQAVLSGYPLFPAGFGGLPVDWRMPTSVLHDMSRTVRAWAREPEAPPEEVLASWAWLHDWLREQTTGIEVAAPLILLACVIPAIWFGRGDAAGRKSRRSALLAVLLPSTATLVAWFFLAPEPRFAWAPLWLVPCAFLAWALPSATPGSLRSVAPWAPVLALTFVVAGVVASRGAFTPIKVWGGGPFRTFEVPEPQLEPFETESGLRLSHPAAGDERCYRALLCTPEVDARLRFRGAGLAEGFTIRR